MPDDALAILRQLLTAKKPPTTITGGVLDLELPQIDAPYPFQQPAVFDKGLDQELRAIRQIAPGAGAAVPQVTHMPPEAMWRMIASDPRMYHAVSRVPQDAPQYGATVGRGILGPLYGYANVPGFSEEADALSRDSLRSPARRNEIFVSRATPREGGDPVLAHELMHTSGGPDRSHSLVAAGGNLYAAVKQGQPATTISPILEQIRVAQYNERRSAELLADMYRREDERRRQQAPRR